jgi:hypothetical protein
MSKSRFERSLLRGRCRRNLVAGLILLALTVGYGSWGANRFGRRGADANAFDQPIVRAALRMVPPPFHLKDVFPRTDRELYLSTVISDQQDVMFGLALLILRMIVTLTFGGLGLVLVSAGATEWEIRSECPTTPPLHPAAR